MKNVNLKRIEFLFRNLFILSALFVGLPSYAEDNAIGNDPLKEFDFQKYTILETTFNYAPLREAADANSKRFTHLKSGISLFADKENSEFYEVDLGLNKPYWIEKRYVEVHGNIPEKRGSEVSKIRFYQGPKHYIAKISTPIQTSYKVYQNKDGLMFQLYDVNLKNYIEDKVDVKTKKAVRDNFSYYFKSGANSSGILTVNFKTDAQIYGYEVKKADDGLVFEIRKPFKVRQEEPFKGVRIALDAGHGGDEKGAVAEGIYEKDINLAVTKQLNKILKKRGAKTFMTRKKDVNVGLYKRVDYAIDEKADFLISIHQNSLANPAAYERKHGAGVYYYNQNARDLAYKVQEELVKATGFKDDGVFNASFALTRSTNPVSILVECGYLIHPYERRKLSEKSFQKVVAEGIADGIEEFLKNAKY